MTTSSRLLKSYAVRSNNSFNAATFGRKYSRMDQVKFVENSL